MNMSRTGGKKSSATFKSNAAEVTPDQMRFFVILDDDFVIFMQYQCYCGNIDFTVDDSRLPSLLKPCILPHSFLVVFMLALYVE
jgi:hypothetical protein